MVGCVHENAVHEHGTFELTDKKVGHSRSFVVAIC
jgi:hypothetical protein